MSQSVASQVPFDSFCSVLTKIARTKKPATRREILSKFVLYWREFHTKIHGPKKTDDSFYPAMRLILPSFDRDRGAYGFKEHALAMRFIQIFVLNKESEDAQAMLKYKAPTAIGNNDTGDFAAIASNRLRNRLTSDKCSLTIEALNEHLDAIALGNASKDKKSVDTELEMLCRKVSESELKWLIRILLKQMKLGLQETSVLSVFHPEASQLYDVTTSLLKVCTQLHDPSTKLDEIQIQLFCPFRPMLANRAPPEMVPAIMNNEPFYMEIKYDGERVQLHKDQSKYKYFSRNANDLTTSYGATPTEGSLTPYLHNVFSTDVKSCIVDGEMVGWNPAVKCYATKGEHFDVKSLRDGDDLNPCFVAFDLLMLNGKVLTQVPLTDRLKLLDSLFSSEVEGRCALAERKTVSSKEEVVEYLNKAVERREEGVVVKKKDSTYRLNTRSNEGGWLKIKPDYVDAMSDDLDLLIVGGYFGDGRRGNLMSHFILALVHPKKEGEDKPSKFQTVCKVGSGYSMAELYKLNLDLNKNRLIKSSKVPDWLEVGSEKPDVYIEPYNSKILQVRAAEITASSVYAAGATLRFPRVEKIREDKSWEDGMTTTEFQELRENSAGKLGQVLDDFGASSGPPAKKKRGGGGKMTIQKKVPENFRPANIKGLKKISDLLSGKEFCILSGNEGWTKQDLEKKVHELGGKCVQHPGVKTFCVVTNKFDLRAKNLANPKGKKARDIAKTEWLVRCIEKERFIQWAPSNLWFSTEATKVRIAQFYDEYGDSYTEELTKEKLDELLKEMKSNQSQENFSEEQKLEFLREMLPDFKYGLFWMSKFYIDRYLSIDDATVPVSESPLELLELKARLYGGRIVDKVSDATHVIINPSDLSRVTELKEINRVREKKFHLVSHHWIEDSIKDGKRREERDYHPLEVQKKF